MNPFAKKTADSVAALGEEKLITAIRRWLGSASPRAPFGIGDDCAVVPAVRGPQLITVDPVIFGRHFDASIPPRAVGAKLLKRNLSDLAAMGGRPTAAVLALTLDPRTSLAWLEAFYRGLAACARRYRVPIVGGDIAQPDGVPAASLSLLGATTGPRPVARTCAGPAASSRAMMDVSDGLAKDLHALTPLGGIPALDPAALPLRRGADLRAALTDGEDYELVFALAESADPVSFSAAWHRAFPRTRLTRLGSFARAGAVPSTALNLRDFSGYEHLR